MTILFKSILTVMSNSTNFNGLSICPKKSISVVSTRNLVTDTIERQRVDAPPVDTAICLSKNATKCFNIPNLEFSNCLPLNLDEGATPPNVITAFNKLNDDFNIIKSHIKPIHTNGKYENRIEQILKKYLDEEEYNSYSDFFYKSDVRTSDLLCDRGSFRVISLYTVEPKRDRRQRHSKHKLVILFFDPYHLFIPSRDYGTRIYSEISGYSSDCNLLHL